MATATRVNGSINLEDVVPPGEEITAWVGFISWERRCLRTLQALKGRSKSIDIFAIDIESSVRQEAQDRRRRQEARAQIERSAVHLSDGHRPDFLVITRNRFDEARKLIAGLPRLEHGVGILDLTCATKKAAVAAAVAMTQRDDAYRWIFAYSAAQGYGPLLDPSLGWEPGACVIRVHGRDSRVRTGASTGIFIPGLTGDRAILAFSEITPEHGLVLLTRAPDRPDLLRMAIRRNQTQLALLEMRGWRTQVIDIRSSAEIVATVDREIRSAAQRGSERIVLYPFGPKPLVFFSAWAIARSWPRPFWLAYPQARRYDLRSATGAAAPVWFPLALPRVASLSKTG